MKTVREACQLQPNAPSVKLSDQIEQLDELISAEGNGTAFFDRTFITQGMKDLITEGIARLAGASSQAVFHLKQAMGGGKRHLLVGFGLLAQHAALRATYCAGMPHASGFQDAAIAAFNGRNSPDHFFWGEIANQLGKGDQFRSFWTSGPKAPDEKDWLKLFEGDQPVLIPIQRAGKTAQLAPKPLDMTRCEQPFNGEEQIEKTLTSNPLKLFLDVEKEFDAIRDKSQDLLWPENQDAFEMRYHETIDPDKDRWELCSRVLSRRDIVDRLSAPW